MAAASGEGHEARGGKVRSERQVDLLLVSEACDVWFKRRKARWKLLSRLKK